VTSEVIIFLLQSFNPKKSASFSSFSQYTVRPGSIMTIIDLIHNIALLVSLSVLYQLMIGHKRIIVFSGILSGFLFGSVGIIAMMTPLHLMPGIIFDGRSIILAVAGLFGGPVTAAIAGVMCAAYRLYLGGGGAIMGVSVITEASLLGVLFFYIRRKHPGIMRIVPLYGFGLLVHVIMVLMMFLLPSGTRLATLRIMALPVLLIYPIATAVVCQLFADQIERMKTLSALSESEKIFSTFMEKSPIYVFFKDHNMRPLKLSANYEKMLGRPVSDILGKSMFELFPPDLAESMVADDMRILNEGKQVTVEEELEGRHYITIKFPIHINGKPTYLAGFTIDITDQKLAEREKERMQGQLIQSQKMEAIGQLAGGVAHDFNNMLTVIIGHAELLRTETAPDSPSASSLRDILKAARHSADLTQQLLAFARKQMVNPIVIDINIVIEDMLNMLHRLIRENITLKWLPDTTPCRVLIDPVQIDQLLANLTVNARDALIDGGIIVIETGKVDCDDEYCKNHTGLNPGKYIMLSVSDNGCGIDKEVLSRIYEPFFTTKPNHKGTGLGLATVYGIVKQNSGFISVYSEPGQGTTFKIFFPLVADATVKSEIDTQSTMVTSGTETILIVEDEQAILDLGVKILSRQGYTVLSAHNPADAIDLAEKYRKHIHLVLTDVVLPEMNGRELMNHIKMLHPEAGSLYMSGYTAEIIAHHGVLEEGVNFIQKPFDVTRLIRKVRSILDEQIPAD
jgi:two-component system, cell cycle sensor histidine kinase and response regulator CckA